MVATPEVARVVTARWPTVIAVPVIVAVAVTAEEEISARTRFGRHTPMNAGSATARSVATD